MFSLIPKEEKYFTLLSELAAKVRAGSEVFLRLFDDFGNRQKFADEIKSFEVQCDTIAGTITGRLNTSFITPIDREDIFLLVKEVDDIMDAINGLAFRFDTYMVSTPRPESVEFAKLIHQGAVELEAAFSRLEKHKDLGVHPKNINDIEKKGDQLYRAAIRRLFLEEKDPIEVIKWMSIYETLEDATDRCKDVAESLEAVVVKNK